MILYDLFSPVTEVFGQGLTFQTVLASLLYKLTYTGINNFVKTPQKIHIKN